jgi:hypothetical protein
MLNLFQHLIRSTGYETLNQVQGDTKRFGQQPLQDSVRFIKKQKEIGKKYRE